MNTVTLGEADRASNRDVPVLRSWTLAVISAATFMLLLDLTVTNVALPKMQSTFDANFSSLQWVLDSYALTLAAFLLTAGSLADRFGRKRLFILGFVLFTLASLACGISQSVLQLNLSRGFQGVGAAILFAVGPAILSNEFTGKARGQALSVFGAVSGLAIAFGPLIGGGLTDALSWRWIFLVNVPIGVVAIAIGWFRIRESRTPSAHPVDISGLVLVSAALATLVFGFLRGNLEGWTSPLIVGLFVASPILFIAFIVVEHRLGEAAMLDLQLFRIPTFNGISIAVFLWNAAVLTSIFLMISFLQNVLGFTPFETGLRFLPMTLVIFFVAGVTGVLTSTVSPKILGFASGALMAVGIALVLLLDSDSPWTALLPCLIVMGLGMGIYNPLRAALSVGIVEPDKAGMSSGAAETFQQAGIAVGIAVFGAIFQSRVTDAFVQSSAGQQLGQQAKELGDGISSGAVNQMVKALPSDQAAQVLSTAHSAYVDGLHEVLVGCSVITAIGALLALIFIRTKDLHETARAGYQDVEVSAG